jgi:hypothetical protein
VAKPAGNLKIEELLLGVKWDSSFEFGMRIHFSSIARPKAVAKKLKASLSFLGHAHHLSIAQGLVARMYGYRDWHELESAIGVVSRSLDDEDLSETQVDARREYQVMRLVDGGIPLNMASYAVRVIGPTARRCVPFFDLHEAFRFFTDLNNLIGATGFRFYTREAGAGTVVFRMNGKWMEDPIRRQENADQINELQPDCAGISSVWPDGP